MIEPPATPGTPAQGTLAFLFSDIEGSTRLEERLGTEAYAAVRERHRALLRAAFTAHGGMEQGTEGDSFFVVFRTASDALAAALEGQRALAAEAWPDGVEVRVRMGVHVGEAAVAGGSLVGLAINRAARIAHAAHGGQVLVSEAVRTLTGAGSTGSAAPAEFTDLGAHRLKDLREPEHLFQAAGPGERREFPPLATLDARPNNLPTQLTSFVGREAELATAAELLAANRLVTLTGPGGTGKTRLSLQVAAAAADDYPDGVFFVALESIRDPGLVASEMVAAIGLSEGGGKSGRDVLVEWLAPRRVLLVLDNLEQVVQAGPLVADLLRAAPGLRVVVTSRAPLHVSGEQEYPLPGLPVPPDTTGLGGWAAGNASAGPADPSALLEYESVRLFVARARSVRPDFMVTAANAAAVAAICARLHGMPLAIELAAARTKLLGPEAILERLDRQLNLLAAGSRDLPERQQTLRGAISWSYDLLDEPHRLLLDRLSVFVGGFELDAAESIAAAGAAPMVLDVLDGLADLTDQSLVRSVAADPPRFRMLETIREFAAEHLAERTDAVTVAEAHTAWYLNLAEAEAKRASGAEQREALERLEREHDNLRAALDRTVAARDAERAVRLSFALWRFWQKRGHLNEARHRVEALAAEPWTRDDPRLRARLMEALGGVLWWQADLPAMGAAYREALELWQATGDKAEIANALYNYAFTFSVNFDPRGDPREADPEEEGLHALESALVLYRELGDRRGEANVLWGLGNREYFQLTEDAGTGHFRQALEIFREVGDVTMEAWSLHMLGSGLARLEQFDEAGPLLRHALRHFYDASDAAGIALLLDDLASLAVTNDDIPRAARLRGAARRLTASTGAGLAEFVDMQFEQGIRPHVRNATTPEELERLQKEGAAMTLDEAVAYALDIPVETLTAGSHVDEPGV